MSVPSHNLYDFVHHVTEKQYWLLRFYPWGNKELTALGDYQRDLDGANGIPKHQRVLHQMNPEPLTDLAYDKQVRNFQPILLCHDQEPLNFDLYQDGSDVMNRYIQTQTWDSSYPHVNFNLRNAVVWSWQKQWTLLHSELNSQELARYESTGKYVGAYWWSHAVIALDWYRYAQQDQSLQYTEPNKLFLIYARDTTGTRQYRSKFLDQIHDFNNHCQIGSVKNYSISSDSSATYDSEDFNHTAFSIVLETLFDDARIHLTEKILRPIACGHPFLLAAGAGSLSLLRRYGFETFSPWINESYDDITDGQQRLQAIVAEMRRISQLSKVQQQHIIDSCRQVAARNKQRFFHCDFFNTITKELKDNVNYAWKKHQGRLSPDFYWQTFCWRRKNKPEYFTPAKRVDHRTMLSLVRRLRRST